MNNAWRTSDLSAAVHYVVDWAVFRNDPRRHWLEHLNVIRGVLLREALGMMYERHYGGVDDPERAAAVLDALWITSERADQLSDAIYGRAAS